MDQCILGILSLIFSLIVKTIRNNILNLIDRHDITEILLKVALNTITTLKSDCSIEFISEDCMAIEKKTPQKTVLKLYNFIIQFDTCRSKYA